MPPALRASGQEFTRDQFHLFRPIQQRGALSGTIFVAADLKELSERLLRYLTIVGIVLLVSLLFGFLLSNQLQRLVSEPILELAKLARKVALERNFGVRAVKKSNDELGELVDGFNVMLGQIQSRDSALQSARDELELRVHERTSQLATTNEALLAENNQRQRTKEELQGKTAFLEAQINSSPDGIWVVGREGRKILQNQKLIDLLSIPPAPRGR